jgi:hypothetical protein
MGIDGDDSAWMPKQFDREAGDKLYLGRRHVASIEPESGMWRVRIPGRPLSDMVNRSRAKDAAQCLVLGILNTREKPVEAPRIHFSEPGRYLGACEHLMHHEAS